MQTLKQVDHNKSFRSRQIEIIKTLTGIQILQITEGHDTRVEITDQTQETEDMKETRIEISDIIITTILDITKEIPRQKDITKEITRQKDITTEIPSQKFH